MGKVVGYTLIEILVTLSIVGIIFAAGYANFREYARRQAVVSGARQVQGDLRLAQEYALSGRKPSGCSILDGYQFRFTSAREYGLYAVCSGAGGVSYFSVKDTLTLTGGVIFNPVPTPNSLLFKSLGQGTDLSPGAFIDITLTLPGLSYTQTVTVTAAGEIR